jgi:glutamate racemase
VNPAYETAIELRELLKREQMDNQGYNKSEENPCEFFVSDAADRFKAFANSILPFDITNTRQISIEEY